MIGKDWLRKWADYTPEKIAFKEQESGRSLSYYQLNNVGNRLAMWLANRQGLRFGDRIAVIAENSLEFVALFVAAQKAGFTLVPLNYRLSSRELEYMVSVCEPRLLISEEKYEAGIAEIVKKNSIAHLGMKDLSVICDAMAADMTPSLSMKVEIPEDHPIFLIFTSGSTSFPKGSIYTHRMLYWNSINTWMRLNITSEDRSINCAPPFHTGSWNVLQNASLLHGAYTLLMKKFDTETVLKTMEEDEHTIFWGVPTMLKMMAESPSFADCSFSKIRYFVVGGEAMPIPLIKTWHDKGVPIRQGYGLTEVGPNVTSLDHTDAIRKAGSIGKPNFYYEVRIVDQDGKDVPDGETGEFLLKGPCVTTGYWKNQEETTRTIVDGWFHTGDIVKRDEEGFIFVVDRIKNMYISGGENVYPAEIEHFLRMHPKIKEVAIIGVPDEKWGEAGKAFIVPLEGEVLNASEVLAFCDGKLARYKIPRHFIFMDDLPRNDAGKIDRRSLKN